MTLAPKGFKPTTWQIAVELDSDGLITKPVKVRHIAPRTGEATVITSKHHALDFIVALTSRIAGATYGTPKKRLPGNQIYIAEYYVNVNKKTGELRVAMRDLMVVTKKGKKPKTRQFEKTDTEYRTFRKANLTLPPAMALAPQI